MMVFFLLIAMLILISFAWMVGNMAMQESLAEKTLVIDGKQGRYQQLLEQQGNIFFDKSQLEEETSEVLTLYELTKDITQCFKEQDAFELFQAKLKKSILFDECHLLEPDSEEYKEVKLKEEYFLFPLRAKNALMGYLALKNVSLDDKEKIIILSHQLALALQKIRLYQEIEKLSITDSLTEAFTRRHILERLDDDLARAKNRDLKLSFLMIDVDYFKRFNDRYGHLVGDRVLRAVSQTILNSIREIDILGRYGGEEFCVILPETERRGAKFVAERIRSAVESSSFNAYDIQVHITVSIGIATFPEDGATPSELIDKADWALYRAKKSGRNAVCSFGIYHS